MADEPPSSAAWAFGEYFAARVRAGEDDDLFDGVLAGRERAGDVRRGMSRVSVTRDTWPLCLCGLWLVGNKENSTL